MIKIIRNVLIIAAFILLIFVVLNWPLFKDFIQESLNNIAMGK